MRRLSQTLKVVLALLISIFANNTLTTAIAYAYTPPTGEVSNVTICHASNSDSNPYISQTPDALGVGTNTGNGDHSTHTGPIWNSMLKSSGTQWGDIIPPFTDTNGRSFAGLNWDAAGQLIYANDCVIPTASVSVAPPACVAADTTGSALITVTNITENSTVTVYDQAHVSVFSSSLSPAATATVTASSLIPGTYTVQVVNLSGAVAATTSFTLEQCVPPTPATPSITAYEPKCSTNGESTGAVSAAITNTDDATDATISYSWTVSQGATTIASGTTSPIADGSSDTITVGSLAPGNYTLTIIGSDQTTASTAFVIPVCQLHVTPCESVTGPELISIDTQFADSQDTRSAGHYEILPSGLHIWTDDATSNAKVAWYHSVNYPLSSVGSPSMNYSASSGIEPGLQLVVDFDGNGTPDGILVGESIYGNNWWLSNSAATFAKTGAPHNGGGYGSNWYGTLDEWLTAFPSAQVKAVGFSLGSGVLASGTLYSLSFGCHQWTFGLKLATPTPPVQDDTCYADNDWYFIPETEGIVYSVDNGEGLHSGWYPANGIVTITASAAKGYYLAEGSSSRWTFTYTDMHCVTMTKSPVNYVDSNGNGVVDVGDTTTWNITLTNTSKERLDDEYLDDHFFVTIQDSGASLSRSSIGDLMPDQSVTITATKPLTADEVSACRATNTSLFSAWRTSGEEISIDEETQPTASGSATAELALSCGQVLGTSTTTTTTTVVAQNLPPEIPNTGPETSSSLPTVLGILISALTYYVVLRRQEARS